MQALAITTIGAIAAWFAAWVAYQQMKIARDKLQQDFYNRRYAVFDAARTFLQDIEVHGNVPQEALQSYSAAIADAVFLLDEDLSKHLEQIRDRAFKFRNAEARAERMADGDARSTLSEKASDENEWLLAQLPVLVEKFKPTLTLPRHQRSAYRWFPWSN
jgi:hypothetical protein